MFCLKDPHRKPYLDQRRGVEEDTFINKRFSLCQRDGCGTVGDRHF